MQNLNNIAHLISKPSGRIRKVSDNYRTNDIINLLLRKLKTSKLDVIDFANAIHSNSTLEISRSIYYFLLNNIRYIEDTQKYSDEGFIFQAVKNPGYFWATKEGDCKSYAVFIASVLQAKKIPHKIRFAAYGNASNVQHVYVVALDSNNNEIIIDPVWGRESQGSFNTQKKYSFIKDYNYMQGLYEMAGMGASANFNKKRQYKPGMLQLPERITEASLEAAIMKQRLEIERNIIAKKRGANSSKVKQYDRSIHELNGFIGALENDDFDQMDAIISGIGNSMGASILKNLAAKAKAAVVKAKDATVKVVTAPARLAAKGAIELVFPIIAPAFLYLFINDAALLNKLPASVREKRARQQKVADFFVDAIGMKRDHFMQILRNGIMKKLDKSPEAILAEQFKGISGVGFVGIAALAASILPKIMEWIPKLAKLFGKKDTGLLDAVKNMFPQDADIPASIINSADIKQVANRLVNKAAVKEPGVVIDQLNAQSYDPFTQGDDGRSGARGICG